MELPTTNITTTLVGNAIGNSSRNVGVLCTAPTINKWSRKKPVREHGSPNWWDYYVAQSGSTIVHYSIEYTWDAMINFNPSKDDSVRVTWNYLLPRGDYGIRPLEGFRLGDFRGYDHSAIKFITIGTVPTGSMSVLTNTSFNHTKNTNSALGLIASDFGLSNYYFGIMVEYGYGATWYQYVKTCTETIGSATSPSAISILFTDLPTIDGAESFTYRWVGFISDVAISDWTLKSDNLLNNDLTITEENAYLYPIPPTNEGTFTVTIYRHYAVSVVNAVAPSSGQQDDVYYITVRITNDGDLDDSQNVYARWQLYTGGDFVTQFTTEPTNNPLPLNKDAYYDWYTSIHGNPLLTSGVWRVVIETIDGLQVLGASGLFTVE